MIFARCCPTWSRGTHKLFVGATLLVVANAAVSQWLRSRGRTWTTAGATFLATLAINVGLVTLDRVLGVRDAADAPALNTLFFVCCSRC